MIKEYEEVINEVGPKFQKILDKQLNEGHPPMFMFGVVMILLADQFKRFNYNVEDFYSFLDYTKTIWEDEKPSKPNLTLIVNNEKFTSNTSSNS